MAEDETPQLLALLDRLMSTTRPDSLRAGFIAYWIATVSGLFQSVPQPRFGWPDPRGVDEPIWAAIRKMIRGRLSLQVLEDSFERLADRLAIDPIDRSLLRQIVSVQHRPRTRDLFDGLCMVGELDFVEAIAICSGVALPEVASRLSPEAHLARSGFIVSDAAPEGKSRWIASPLLNAALAVQQPR